MYNMPAQVLIGVAFSISIIKRDDLVVSSIFNLV
jgi:hypothetical protein